MSARLLIIDNDPALLAGLSDGLRLRMPEIEAQTVTSADQALKLLATMQFDVILCDVVMPGMSGLEFLSHARQHCPKSSVILMTGCQEEFREEAGRLGAADFLAKPFTADRVVWMLHKVLEQASLLRRLHETNRLSELAGNELRRS